MQYVDLDFETKSACDLKASGAWRYAEDPTTEVLVLSYALPRDGWDTLEQWFPPGGLYEPLHVLAADPNVVFVAHNASFEQAIWAEIMVKRYGFPPLPPERWECTLAACAWKSLPLALDKAARALHIPIEKDAEGNRLTLSMSRFDKKTGNWPELTPEKLGRIAAYCDQDVRVERAVEKRVGLLSKESKHERGIWLMDQRINQRGVRLDMGFVRAAQQVIERASHPLRREFADLTGGLAVGQVAEVLKWCRGQDVELENLQKGTIEAALQATGDTDDAGYESLAEDDDAGRGERGSVEPNRLPSGVRRALQIRQMLGSASIKKLNRMQACVGEDGRARGLLQYHAAHPGRWGGRLLQPQNFPRGSGLDPDTAVAAIMTGDPEYVEAMLGLPAIEAVAHSLRFAIIANPGKILLSGDFAQVEARIVLALAGQHDKVAVFAERGSGIYLDMAEAIYRLPAGSLDKHLNLPEYVIGKNTILGCGFQMGADRFHDRYCPDQPWEFARTAISTYREDFAPKVPPLWYALDAAGLRAAKGTPTESYGVSYQREGDWLTARLPSRWQKIWYYAPELGRDERFDRECWSYWASKGGKIVNTKAYGGLLTENAVQALARGLLCASIQRLEQAGFPVVLTVHDEAVCEVDEGADLKAFEEIMATPTVWAREIGIPIAVEAWAGERYRK